MGRGGQPGAQDGQFLSPEPPIYHGTGPACLAMETTLYFLIQGQEGGTEGPYQEYTPMAAMAGHLFRPKVVTGPGWSLRVRHGMPGRMRGPAQLGTTPLRGGLWAPAPWTLGNLLYKPFALISQPVTKTKEKRRGEGIFLQVRFDRVSVPSPSPTSRQPSLPGPPARHMPPSHPSPVLNSAVAPQCSWWGNHISPPTYPAPAMPAAQRPCKPIRLQPIQGPLHLSFLLLRCSS